MRRNFPAAFENGVWDRVSNRDRLSQLLTEFCGSKFHTRLTELNFGDADDIDRPEGFQGSLGVGKTVFWFKFDDLLEPLNPT